MKQLAFGAMILCLILGACAPVSAKDAEATSMAAAVTFGAQTVEARPTLTPPPPPANTATAPIAAVIIFTNTWTPSATITRSPTASSTATVTGTLSSPTTTVTGTISSPMNTVTGTLPSPTKTVTGTPPTPTITPTDLMVTRVYGTQPPYVDYGRIELRNLSKTQVYISFQCTTPEGYYVVEEYPVGGSYFKVSVAAGHCQYVAWVGGREFTGEFGLSRFEELIITFKKQSVTIQ
jgi:hypothetical protein